MTFVIKTRGDSSALMLREYYCDAHGRWERLEPRATAPDEAPCPECGAISPWCISAPATHMPVATVVRGTSDERPPGALDTRAIADGMPTSEWRKRYRKDAYTKVRDKLINEVLK